MEPEEELNIGDKVRYKGNGLFNISGKEGVINDIEKYDDSETGYFVLWEGDPVERVYYVREELEKIADSESAD